MESISISTHLQYETSYGDKYICTKFYEDISIFTQIIAYTEEWIYGVEVIRKRNSYIVYSSSNNKEILHIDLYIIYGINPTGSLKILY